MHTKLLQSCLTLCDPVYCSPPGSSVHGIFQAKILEWVAMLFLTQDRAPCLLSLLHCRQTLPLSHRGRSGKFKVHSKIEWGVQRVLTDRALYFNET